MNKQTDFFTLTEAVIAELKSMEYMDSSLTNYRRLYARLRSFMEDHSVKEYSQDVGKSFVAEYYPLDTNRRRAVLLMIRRLDDYLNNIPYRCHRAMNTPDVPPAFTGELNNYLKYCSSIGNKPRTIDAKKILLSEFSSFSL